MQTRKCEECIRQISVNIFGGFKYCSVFFDPKIEIKNAEVENTTMIEKSHNAEDRNNEHQSIEREMYRAGKAARECPNIRRQRWR
jgi:hypothetical protein